MKIIFFIILVGLIEPFIYGFVPASELFPYGPANGDTQLPIADDNFVNVTLMLGNVFNFFNSSYSSLFVNNNGAISFIQGVSQYTPTCMPLSVPMIVPFWADVDTRKGGTVHYRETTTRSILLKASEEIRRGFPTFHNINLGWSFIITWDNVAFYGAVEEPDCRGTDKRNTFQTILTTDGQKSFAIFLYNTITWTTGTASSGNKCSGLGGTPAKAGFDVGDGNTFFDIAGTCTAAILNITETTNVGQAGKWIFRIDNGLQSSGCLSSEQAALQQLTISPSLISIFGNNPITIRGPCMVDATRVRCRFNDISPKTVNAVVSSENVATCVVPYLYKNGRIKVDLLVMRVNGVEETFSGFIYTIKPDHELPFNLVGTSDFRVSWDVANFGGRNATQTLDLELVEFFGGVWTSRGVIKENLSNTGTYSGPLNTQGVTAFKNLRNVYVVRLRPSSQLGRSVATNDNTNSIFSDILFSLANKTETELDELCNSWYIIDEGAPTDALPCPPLLSQARVDERFEVVDDLLTYNPGAEIGYRQRVPSASGAGQRCTYRNGMIIVGPPSGGNVRSVSPNGNFGVVSHAVADISPWYMCCKLTTNAANCRKYYERRPSDTGRNYVPPTPTTVVGDPHIITYDRVPYTFNGVGEFWMIKGVNDSFLMQARMAQYISSSGVPLAASVFTAFVMQQKNCNDDNVRIQVTLTLNGIQITLDGEDVAMDREPNQPKRTIMHNGASIAIYSSRDVRITFRSGYSFTFSAASNTAINMGSMASVDLKGQTKGLLGVFDGNRSNEYTQPDGVVVSPIATSPMIHHFGMQWRIDAESSLFTYPSGTSYADYQNEYFVPSFEAPNLNSVPPQAVAACFGSEQCLFDLFVTGSTEFANSTLEAIDAFNRTAEILDMVVGMCEAPLPPENGYLEAVNYLVGSSIKLVCDDNLQVNGQSVLTCNTDSNGVHSWNAEFGVCSEIINRCANANAWLQWLCEMGLSR